MAVVVITGCSSGFGMLAALEFARRGDSVYATMRNTAKAGRLHAGAEAAGAAVELLQLDVNDIRSVGAAGTLPLMAPHETVVASLHGADPHSKKRGS
jgi:NAD(P)-dependent dehydrogenase (short-subunit alcohol dehydrogenase family)